MFLRSLHVTWQALQKVPVMHYMGICLFVIQVSSLFCISSQTSSGSQQQSERTEMPSRGQQKLFQKQILKPALINNKYSICQTLFAERVVSEQEEKPILKSALVRVVYTLYAISDMGWWDKENVMRTWQKKEVARTGQVKNHPRFLHLLECLIIIVPKQYSDQALQQWLKDAINH